MSALVWATESALLGLWAIVFSLYSNAFHAFVARSHALISAATLLLHLVAAARDLPIGHAVSEAFVCAVSGLFLVYLAALLDPGNHATLFTAPVADFLPVDGCIGLGWFAAALVSALGMALCERGRRTSLMFHHFGYHMLVVLPSLLILWLYDYDGRAANGPVSALISLVQSAAHALFFLVWVVAWGMFILLQVVGEGILAFEKPWPKAWAEVDADFWLYLFMPTVFKFLGRAMPILASVSAALVARTAPQAALMWALLGVAAANSLDFLQFGGWVVARASELLADLRRFNHAAAPLPSAPSEELVVAGAGGSQAIFAQPAPVQMNTDIFRLSNASRAVDPPRWRDKMV